MSIPTARENHPMRTFLCTLVLLSLAAAEDVVAPGLGEDLDRAVQGSTGGGFWGAVLVARGEEVLLAKGYGYADYGQQANTSTTLFEIASTSKPITALAIFRLVAKGKLTLVTTLGELFEGAPEDKAKITIRQLLDHTSGISAELGLPYASTASREELIERVLETPLASAPGERFAYCNVAYALLAAIVEVRAEASFEDFVRAEIFEPAGMSDSGFVQDPTLDSARVSSRLGRGETRPTGTAVEWFWSWGYRGMGGVVTTVHDLHRLDRALRSDTLLDEAEKSELYRPELEGYACGWQIGTTPRGARRVSHSGSVAGYVCDYRRDLDDDVVIVILSNGRTSLQAVSRAIDGVLYPRPRVTLTIDRTGYELNRHRAVELGGGAVWEASARDDGVQLDLRQVSTVDRAPLAALQLPDAAARELLAKLRTHLGREREQPPGMEAGAYLMPYPEFEATLELEDLGLVVMPRYRGVGEDGVAIVDERVTLVVQDASRHAWAVMAKMDDPTVEALCRVLEAALE